MALLRERGQGAQAAALNVLFIAESPFLCVKC